MVYSAFLILHICGGLVGILSGMLALLVRKGFPLHRSAGKAFVISMLLMSSSGACMAFVKLDPANVFAGVLTFYLVATAWLTVARREGETSRVDIGLLLVAVAAGAVALILGWMAAHAATHKLYGNPAAGYFVFALIALLVTTGDIRMLIRGGVSGAGRLGRHLWRMCTALFIAAGSFFLGTSKNPLQLRARLFDPIRYTHLPELPVLIIFVLTIFWILRVRFSRKYREA